MRISSITKWFCATALAVLLACPVAVPYAVQTAQAAEFVTIGTGGITGVYYPVGGAICRLVNKSSKGNNIRCTVESTGASVLMSMPFAVETSAWALCRPIPSSTHTPEQAQSSL